VGAGELACIAPVCVATALVKAASIHCLLMSWSQNGNALLKTKDLKNKVRELMLAYSSVRMENGKKVKKQDPSSFIINSHKLNLLQSLEEFSTLWYVQQIQ
jgi:hypothetical protein